MLKRVWQLKQSIRSRVDYRHLNVLSDYDALGRFDLIFCRNVLIYFEPEPKADVLNRMASVLAPDGVAALGASENTIGLKIRRKQHAKHQFDLRRLSSTGNRH